MTLYLDGTDMKFIFNGESYILRLDSDDKPYVLKRLKWNDARSRQYFGIVWANWHKSPFPARRQDLRAIQSRGWAWSRDAENFGWTRKEGVAR